MAHLFKTDFSKLATLVAKQDAIHLAKFKAHCEANLRKMAENPANMIDIDWNFYKSTTADRAMVEALEKSFKSLKIDYPIPPPEALEKLEKSLAHDLAKGKEFIAITSNFIEKAEAVKEKFKKMIPLKDMNIEDFYLTFPDWGATYDRPSIWPHLGRWPGLTREQAAAQESPDPLPYSTPAAHKYWDEVKNKWY